MIRQNELKIMNETTILYLKKIGKSYKRNEIINKILDDNACFFKMEKEDAYIILEDIGVGKDKVEEIYSELISEDVYYNLLKSDKIKEDDKELKIKYQTYDYNDLFKKKESSKKQEERNDIILTECKKENFIKKLVRKIMNMFYIKRKVDKN